MTMARRAGPPAHGAPDPGQAGDVRGRGSAAGRRQGRTKHERGGNSSGNRAAARTRRQRGYQWEDTLVKRFNSSEGWRAFRLGSPSTGLPDILAVNPKKGHLVVIEAKSGSGTALSVPAEQVERCRVWADTFSAFKKRHVILAYKFISKRRIGTAEYRPRELHEFYKVRGHRSKTTECICTYDGRFYTRREGLDSDYRVPVRGAECVMPFETRQPAEAVRGARIIF